MAIPKFGNGGASSFRQATRYPIPRRAPVRLVPGGTVKAPPVIRPIRIIRACNNVSLRSRAFDQSRQIMQGSVTYSNQIRGTHNLISNQKTFKNCNSIKLRKSNKAATPPLRPPTPKNFFFVGSVFLGPPRGGTAKHTHPQIF